MTKTPSEFIINNPGSSLLPLSAPDPKVILNYDYYDLVTVLIIENKKTIFLSNTAFNIPYHTSRSNGMCFHPSY